MTQLGIDMVEVQERQARRRGCFAVLLALGLIAGLALAGYVGVTRAIDGLRGTPTAAADYPGPGGRELVVEVRRGESAAAIAERLRRAGVVASAGAFTSAAQAQADEAAKIQPGFYRLRQKMKGTAAFEALLDPSSRAERRVTVREGLRLGETYAALSKGTGIKVAEFRKAARDDDAIGLPEAAEGDPEGFLFPATYAVRPDAKARDVLKLMTDRYRVAAKKLRASGSEEFDEREIVTIASLVEAEARRPQDFGKVARVVYNRLDAGMPLQFDSTVNYALKEREVEVTTDDLDVDSPYNTYENDGLPPGPIGSPGEAALRAAISPPEGDWRYFIAPDVETGVTEFYEGFDDFSRTKRKCKAAGTC